MACMRARLLDVGDVVHAGDERGRAAEEGVGARRIHHRVLLALRMRRKPFIIKGL